MLTPQQDFGLLLGRPFAATTDAPPLDSHPLTEPWVRAGATAVSPWIPREVRCRRCRELACMDINEHVGDDEIAVRYVCPDCGWEQTRHFHESELDGERFS